MAFTKAYAKILAGMLPPNEHIALAFIAGKAPTSAKYATEDTLNNLAELDLVRRTQSVEDNPRDLVLLTAKGKKVAEFV